MAFATDERLLTTREAADLVGRAPDTIKYSIRHGLLPGERIEGFWRVRAEDVVAWDAQARRLPCNKRRAYERAADVLAEYGSVTPVELSKLLGVHEGNARKYLAILAAEDRAHRHTGGEWFPGPTCDEHKEIAS